MKRRHDDEHESSNEKQRKILAGDIFDDKSLSNCLCNMDSPSNATGYFTGSVNMLWAHLPDKFMWNFITQCCVAGGRTHGGPTRIMDQIQLSLDGVGSIKPKDSKSAAKLIYKEGVVFRRHRKAESCFVNTWQLEEGAETGENLQDWFATPTRPVADRLSEIARRTFNGGSNIIPIEEENREPTPTAQDRSGALRTTHSQNGAASTEKRTKHSIPAPVDDNGDVSIMTSSLEPAGQQPVAPALPEPVPAASQLALPAPKPRKTRKRGRKKRRVAEFAATKTVEQALAGQRASTPPVASSSKPVTTSQSQNPATAPGSQVIRLSELYTEKITYDTPGEWMTQLQHSKLQPYPYVVLKEAKKPRTRVSVIGISGKPPELMGGSIKGGFTIVYLQNPSLLEMGPSRYFSVAIFQRHLMEWLPQSKTGDILILHDIQVQEPDEVLSGVGCSGTVQWAAYSVNQGCFVQPHAGALEDRELVGSNRHHTPFLRVMEPEERYCRKLGEWWKQKMAGSAEAVGQVYQLNDGTLGFGRRQQLLLCDAGPDTGLDGHFDCVFEVVYLFENKNRKYSLYVTDYTRNPAVSPRRAQLHDHIVKFELRGAAAILAGSFAVGTYWAIENAQMVYDCIGYVKGKLAKTKARQLDSDDEYPPLKALLKRREEWKKRNGERNGGRPGVFQHKLLRDAQDGQYITCTVELLHITKRGPDVKYLHVTDYTAHPELSSYRYGESWSQDLEGRIVSILLRDAQEQHANTLHMGAFLTVNNLHLRDSKIKKRFQGELGGQEVLICPLNSKHPNDNLQALFKRKAEYEREKDDRKQELESKRRKALALAAKANSTIRELTTDPKEHLRARVVARVTNYYPHSPTEWIRTYCSKCKQKIPEGKRARHHRQDIDHECVRHKFESGGDQMDILLKDECEFLHGLEMGDWIQRPNVVSEFVQRLRPLLGNVSEKQTDYDEIVTDTDFVRLIIGRYRSTESSVISILLAVEN
ncbi:hypothetical protein P691DRAFT_804357 [Macrolepiota fuliginosa MF-IS2]|uniref:Protection of telomeres protein 1 ssDNA-binding domain-containing protein n=1 Tax=Macrolepiota fuliginosa MF-IS2 TaxID=1400762 RepID=A0A9P5X8A0_9AGAR|nr:hypothetical protein P691DRAFT_804357 [Macrolepiota fuliginosa MF-IS2]